MAKKEENGRVLAVLVGVIFILTILLGTNPPSLDALGTYIVFSGVSFFIYRFSRFRFKSTGIRTDNIAVSMGWALLFAGGFWTLTKIFPGFNLVGLPAPAATVGENLRVAIIVLIAPIVEEILFRGAMIGYLRNLKPLQNRLQLVLIIQAVLFAFAHLTAYSTGFYDYPFQEGILGLSANAASFLAAGVFGYLAGWLVTRNGIRNLIASIVLHMILNAIILFSLAVVI